MPAFAAKLAGPLLVLGALLPLFAVAGRVPEQSLSATLGEFTGAHVAPKTMPPLSSAAPAGRLQEDERQDDFSKLGPAIEALLQDQPAAKLGVAVRWSNGETLYLRNSGEPFPLASVAKVYMLVAYLDRLEREHRGPDESEVDLLRSMIDVSDNDAAEEIWHALGGLDAMQRYLARIGMQPLTEPPEGQDWDDEQEAWGDASQTASQMSLFLARLWQRELLDPEYTQLARLLLDGVVEEQAWGVTTGVDTLDPIAKVLFKNGWYPTDDGYWRINSAGIVIPGQGEPYVLVIFGRGFESWSDGVEVVNAIASMINALLLG